MNLRTQSAILTAMILAVICAASSGAADALVLTNAAQVRALSQEDAARQLRVRLQGVVIGEASYLGFVMHDGSEGIYIEGAREQVSGLRRRDLIQVEGVTDPGGFAPIVRLNKIRKAGQSEIPQPRPVTFEQLIAGKWDAQWVEISGIVRWCESSAEPGGLTRIDLATGGEHLAVHTRQRFQGESFVDAEVRVRGICFNQHNVSRQLVSPILDIPSGEKIEVLTPAPAEPFAAPATDVAKLLQFAPEGSYGHRVRVQGVVTHQRPGEFLWLRDGERGLRVRIRQTEALAPGDVVDVLGFPNRGSYSPTLEDAVFRRTAATNPPEPLVIAGISNAPAHDADLIHLDARLGEVRSTREGWVITLDWHGTLIAGVLRAQKDFAPPAGWQPDSIVRVAGICSVETSGGGPDSGVWQPDAFQILLRSPADLIVLQAAPWWNEKRVIWLLAAVTLGLVAAAVGGAIAARRRLNEQQRQRSMAEAEFSAILTERNRMAREIHDTIAQGLVATSVQLRLARKQAASDAAPLLASIDTAQQLVRSSLDEARNSIWNMRSQVLETGDLPGALKNILSQMAGDAEHRTHVAVIGNSRRLSPIIENNVLRLGQEAITNAIKHSGARQITLTLDYGERMFRLCVKDDGRGFDTASPRNSGGGFGLVGMRERAGELKAELVIRSAVGSGTEISLAVPLPGQDVAG